MPARLSQWRAKSPGITGISPKRRVGFDRETRALNCSGRRVACIPRSRHGCLYRAMMPALTIRPAGQARRREHARPSRFYRQSKLPADHGTGLFIGEPFDISAEMALVVLRNFERIEISSELGIFRQPRVFVRDDVVKLERGARAKNRPQAEL